MARFFLLVLNQYTFNIWKFGWNFWQIRNSECKVCSLQGALFPGGDPEKEKRVEEFFRGLSAVVLGRYFVSGAWSSYYASARFASNTSNHLLQCAAQSLGSRSFGETMVLQRDCNFCKQCINERCWRASQALCWHSMGQVESPVRVPCMADTCDQDVPQWCTAEGLTGGTLPSYCRGWHLCCTASEGTQVVQKTFQKTDGFWVAAQKPLWEPQKRGLSPQNSWNKSMIYSWIPLRLCWHSCCVVYL